MTSSTLSMKITLAVRLVLAVALGVGAAGLWHGYHRGQDRALVIPGVLLNGAEVGGRPLSRLRRDHQAREQAFLEKPVTLRYPGGTFQSTYHSLGVIPMSDRLWNRLASVGRAGGFFAQLFQREQARRGHIRFAAGFSIDPERALRILRGYKDSVDSRARSARLDLANRRILPGLVGHELDVYESLDRILAAARAGRSEVTLEVKQVKPKLSSMELKGLDISTVLGWYETPYSLSRTYVNRTYNLRVAARKLNGTIIMPGEVFDFNVALGPRTHEEGYRIAPVIARGELVDGIAGGVCQISSTLFAAAFFAGLDVVKAEVHSMPSHYIELGLDATVVWPHTTLQLGNPYDFPVVIHYDVSSGRVRAEILGKERPYKIGFERRIVGDRAFKEELREDETLLEGEQKVEQRGQRGYAVRRRRIFFDKEGHEVRSQYWTVVYPPTTMILRLGTKKPEPSDAPEPASAPRDPGTPGETATPERPATPGETATPERPATPGETGDKKPVVPRPVNPMSDPASFVRKIQ